MLFVLSINQGLPSFPLGAGGLRMTRDVLATASFRS